VRRPTGGIFALLVLGAGILAGASWWIYSTRPTYRLRQGQAAARAGDLSTAMQFADLLEGDQRLDEAALLRGEVYFRQGENREAIGWLKRVSKDKSDLYHQAGVLAAQVLMAQKMPREASQVLLQILDENPDHVDAHRWLAVIYYDQGDATRAVPHLQEVARLDPSDFRPHRLMGLIFQYLDSTDDAISAYTEALKRNPPADVRDEVRHELAECQLKQFRYQDVLATIGDLTTPEAISFRVEAISALGRPAEADRILAEGIESHPENARLLRIRGERARAHGDYAAAAEFLERAVAIDPSDFRAHYQLVLTYEGLKQLEKAEKQRQRHDELKKLYDALSKLSAEASKDPWNEGIRWELASLCEKLHKPQLAEMWRKAARACRQSK